MKPLATGTSTFKDIINNHGLYIDKTEHIYNLVKDPNHKYYFLSRPRRFGKSLLVSTLEEVFNGNKHLFKGLYIYDKYDFKNYPVIKLFLNDLIYSEGIQEFKESILYHLSKIYREYNLELETDNYLLAFKQLIEKLSKKEKVVILIDEYDKPIIEYIGENIERSKEMRSILKNFYETIKANDEYIHFAFLTGVSKFSKVSIFSSLNNLNDITMNDKYSTICGYTEDELYYYFDDRIKLYSEKAKQTQEKSKEEIKRWYNGYSWDNEKFVYNPYGILTLFENMRISNYWFETGTPTWLIKLIKDQELNIEDVETIKLTEDSFSTYDIEDLNIYALLFQAGYLTIKNIEHNLGELEYLLEYPNLEVKKSFTNLLLKGFTDNKLTNKFSIMTLLKALYSNNLKMFFDKLTGVFASIPYQIIPEQGKKFSDTETYYHTVIYLILKLIGVNSDSEISTNKGRIDTVIETDKNIYIFEFKITSVSQAMNQIEDKRY